MPIPRAVAEIGEVRHRPRAGDGQGPRLCQRPAEAAGSSAVNHRIRAGIIRRDIVRRVAGDQVGGCFHLGDAHGTPPMDLSTAAALTVVSLGNCDAVIRHPEYNHGMGAVVYPQNVPHLHVGKREARGHSRGQAAEGRVAELIGKRDAAQAGPRDAVLGSALPRVLVGLVGPGRALLIPDFLLQSHHGRVDLLGGGDRLPCVGEGCGHIRAQLRRLPPREGPRRGCQAQAQR